MHDYQAPAQLLQDRVILVTGAGDGLGRAAAIGFARHGATVVLLGRTVDKLEATYDAIVAAGGPRAAIAAVDLASADYLTLEQVATSIDTDLGRLDGILHSAAELGVLTPLGMYDPALWMKVAQVNLHAPYFLTRLCLPLLQRSPDASVLFTTAEVAQSARAYWGAYAVTNAAIENLVRVWSDEHDGRALRFNAIDPGAVRSNLRARAFPGEDPNRLPEPESRLAAYLYLMGPDSHAVRGQILRPWSTTLA